MNSWDSGTRLATGPVGWARPRDGDSAVQMAVRAAPCLADRLRREPTSDHCAMAAGRKSATAMAVAMRAPTMADGALAGRSAGEAAIGVGHQVMVSRGSMMPRRSSPVRRQIGRPSISRPDEQS